MSEGSFSVSFYNERGEIVGALHGPKHQVAASVAQSTRPWVDGAHDADTMYVDRGRAIPRPKHHTVLSGHTLTGLPVPCVIEINGQEYECDSDTAELVFDQNTTYHIIVRAWPFQDQEFVCENNP